MLQKYFVKVVVFLLKGRDFMSTEENLHKESNSKKKIIFIIISAVVLLVAVLSGLFFNLNKKASPDEKIEQLIQAVKSDDASQLKSVLDNDVTDMEAKAYFAYIDDIIGKDNFTKSAERVKAQVKTYHEGEMLDEDIKLLEVTRSGKKWVFFNDYSMEIPKYKVEIDSNGLVENVQSFKYKKGKEDVEWKAGDVFAELIPGKYEIDGVSTLNNGTTAPATVKTVFEDGLNENNHVVAKLSGSFYFIKLKNKNLESSWNFDDTEREAFEKAVYKLNGKNVEFKKEDDGLLYGPLIYGEAYEITGEMNLYGQKIKMDPLKFNLNKDNISDSGEGYESEENLVIFEFEFNKDEIKKAQKAKADKDRKERQYNAFKDNARNEIESFLYQYLYALESMYDTYDYDAVSEYIASGSGVENTLRDNVNNKRFKNMRIYNVRFSHFGEDGDNYSIRVKSTRDHDDISSPATFTTQYSLTYLKDENRLVITNFQDL